MAKKKEWRPVSSYFDLNGLSNPEYNKDTFKQFVNDFGWKEYMFSPVVRSFWKLLSGQPDYNYEDRDGLGFSRLLDRSFEQLGGHNRAFRNGQDVMMSAVFLQIPWEKLEKWCKDHPGIRYVVCKQQYDFHYQGHGFLVLFMTDMMVAKYADVLRRYQEAF